MQSLILPMQSDPIMCGCNSSTRPEGAIEASFSDSRRKGDVPKATFLVLTYLDVTASTAQLCLMTQDEKREGEVAGSTRETRERLRIVARERKQNVGENYSKRI